MYKKGEGNLFGNILYEKVNGSKSGRGNLWTFGNLLYRKQAF